ncbi:hypothetical protein MPSEU_000859100 [Mayamaea pseudoterrestris]|nr:hypothetical protein MPSEU_000859100 [Mayamaea pseudoterrestris]
MTASIATKHELASSLEDLTAEAHCVAATPLAEAAPASSTSTTLLVLHSTTCPHRHAKRHQQEIFQILDSITTINYIMLDGADLDCRSARDDLFLLSGLHAVYPQLFVMENNEHVSYWGGYERFHQAHERGILKDEIMRGCSSEMSINVDDQNDAPVLDMPADSPQESRMQQPDDYSSSSEEEIDLLQIGSSVEALSPGEDVSEAKTLELPVTSFGNDHSKGETADSKTAGTGGDSSEPSGSSSQLSSNRVAGNDGGSSQNAPAATSKETMKDSSSSASHKDKTDITIYGATSFVAQNHVLTYLSQVSLHLPRVLHVTLAGRSLNKLQALADAATRKMDYLTTMTPHATGRCIFNIHVANGADEEALLEMAKATRCVLNCAGPFRRYSSLVVGACAKAGTDYVDITGEVSWAGEMRQKYGSVAQESGARIISFCGFDSVPSDLAVFAGVEALRAARRKKNDNAPDEGETLDIETATTWHYCVGMANGGTIHTALDMPVSLDALRHPVPYLLDDPLVLTHSNVRQNPKMQATRNRLAMSEWWNQLPSFDSIFLLGVSIPFFMAVVNAKIVFASSVALKYGPKFTYRERFLPVGYQFTSKLGPLSIIPGFITYAGIMLGMALLKLPFIGSWLASLAPPGTGMSDEACHRGITEVYAVVESSKSKDGSNDRASCHIKMQGDPGNRATAQCITESALCLVLNREKLPPKSVDGFGTPAELLGHALLERLQSSSVRPVSIKTAIRQNVKGRDWSMI